MTEQELKELEADLWHRIEAGEITPDEAEDEWREVFDPEPRYCGREW